MTQIVDMAAFRGPTAQMVDLSKFTFWGPPQDMDFFYKQSTRTGQAWLRSIHGRTVSYNQLVVNGDFSNGKTGWSGTGSVTDGIYTVSWPASYSNNGIYQGVSQIRTIIGHKYYVRAWIQNLEEQARSFYLGIPYVTSDRVARIYDANEAAVMSGVYTATGASTADGTGNAFKLYSSVGGDASIKTTGIMVIDLTQAGLDSITTPAEFEAWQMEQFGHKGYLGYTPGKLVNVNPTGVLTTGRNQWDEEWEQGSFNGTTGAKIAGAYVRSKNKIAVIQDTDYYIIPVSGGFWIGFYDAAGNYLGNTGIAGRVFHTPSNASFINIHTYQNYGNTYKYNICINISDPSFNGQYEPYNGHTLPLDFTEHFPTGMNGVNGIFDEVVSDENGKFTDGDKRFGKVDLGDLNWSYNSSAGHMIAVTPSDASSGVNIASICGMYPQQILGGGGWSELTDKHFAVSSSRIRIMDSAYTDPDIFKAAVTGIPLVYELATPQHVTFTDPSDAVYPVTEGGTEQVQPVNGSEPTTGPLLGKVSYKQGRSAQ